MARAEKFEFDRSRGVVWVCDLASSSKYLNDDHAVDALEQFLPRLHWTASSAVAAARGEFIKWTGDGFLAWFPTPLHRQLGEKAAAAFEAARQLTFFVNVTQLGAKPERRFRIRHGIAYEQDALITKITYPGGFEALDLMGRAVVLAFRLSGISAGFPGIVTQKDLIDALRKHSYSRLGFERWRPSEDERLKYFKGERLGTSSVYVSVDRKGKIGPRTALRRAKKAIAQAEGRYVAPEMEESNAFVERFFGNMLAGPAWCREAVEEAVRFVEKDLLGTVKELLPAMEKAVMESQPRRKSMGNNGEGA